MARFASPNNTGFWRPEPGSVCQCLADGDRERDIMRTEGIMPSISPGLAARPAVGELSTRPGGLSRSARSSGRHEDSDGSVHVCGIGTTAPRRNRVVPVRVGSMLSPIRTPVLLCPL